jgi:hypothetical protein
LAWARVFVALLPRGSAGHRADAIIEILKYPTAALGIDQDDGRPKNATIYLLSSLFPAKGLYGGDVVDALDWVARTYPEVDLTDPPKRPRPFAKAVAALAAPRDGQPNPDLGLAATP